MNERIKNHVESLFEAAPRSKRAMELKDELISNLTEKYNDLVAQTQDEELAYKTTIAGIGDIDELIRGLREREVFDPLQIQMQRQKSALLTSVAVAIYILSFIPLILSDWMGKGGQIAGIVLMFACWAAATMLIVYNAMSKPRYVKEEDTLVEDFKEWKSAKEKKSTMRKTGTSLIFMIALLVYLLLGFFFDLWHPGWLVFILAVIVTNIIRLISLYIGVE